MWATEILGKRGVHDSVLAAMLRMSQRYRIRVSVVRIGHPLYVFGTDRLSDRTHHGHVQAGFAE
jgi:hypothetical protein